MVRQVRMGRMVRAENIHHPFLDLIYGHDSLGEALKKTISIWLRWSSYKIIKLSKLVKLVKLAKLVKLVKLVKLAKLIKLTK